MPIIRTLGQPLRHEIPKIRGSRFFASLERADDPGQAMAFVELLREEFPDATHHCFAWRCGPGGEQVRHSDDGEPNGTAGRPILQEIEGRGLTNVVAVVTRYYGGTKLGTGGLVRAYGEAAAAALDKAGIQEEPVVEVLELRHGYDDTGAVKGVLTAFDAKILSADYGTEVELRIAVPVEHADAVKIALRDATQGRLDLDD